MPRRWIGQAPSAACLASPTKQAPRTFAHGGFTPAWAELLQTPADKMHALLVERADALMGCTEGSPEEAELAVLTDAIEAYETVRWPNVKIAGGKGG